MIISINFRWLFAVAVIPLLSTMLLQQAMTSQRRIVVPGSTPTLSRTGRQSKANKLLSRTPSSIPAKQSSSSTVVFEEDFEGTSGFPSTGWKMVDADGGGTTDAWFQGNTSVFTAYSGSGYAAANYQGANDFLIDQWLISPQISSIEASDTLEFWERSPDNSLYADSIEVLISTTDTARSSFTIVLDYFKTSTSGWAQKRYPLKNFVSAGSNIYVAFRYLLYDAGVSGLSSDYVGIDLVQIVRPQVAIDIQALEIDDPTPLSKQVVGETFPLEAIFENVGSTDQTSIPVRIRVYTPSGIIDESNQTISSLSSGQSVQVTFGNYTATTTGTYTIRAYALVSGDQNKTNDSVTATFRGAVLLSGTYTVGTDGMITSLEDAFDSLNNNIIAGDVTLSLTSDSYTEPPLTLGTLDYSQSANIIIKPAEDVSATINVTATSSQPYAIKLNGASKITLDGSNSSLSTRNVTLVASGTYGEVGVFVQASSSATADSNVIENLSIETGADSLSSSSDYYGVLLAGYSSSYPNVGNLVSNCEISHHGATGIGSEYEDGLIIENNFIHDWTQTSGVCDLAGIWLFDGTLEPVVHGNVIGNLKNNVNGGWACGIENGAGAGSSVWIYNNMIYGILSYGSGSQTDYSRGIFSSSASNSGDWYCFNSVDLSGTDLSTSTSSRASGFECVGGSDITLKDNIFVNNISLTAASTANRAYCIYLASTPTDFVSNYNDLYAPGAQGAIGFNSANDLSILSWRHSFSTVQDSMSLSSDPLFVEPDSGDLHIRTDTVSPVNNAGTPVSGITTDIDGTARNSTSPDIGADEFTLGETTISVNFTSGWNLISIPVTGTDNRRESLFSTSSSPAFGYKGRYLVYDTMQCGLGYWLRFNEAQTVKLTGSPKKIDTLDLSAGWNMIGSLSKTIAPSSVTQVPDGVVTSRYFMYDGTYVAADSLRPGKGYWVKMKEAGKLILTSP